MAGRVWGLGAPPLGPEDLGPGRTRPQRTTNSLYNFLPNLNIPRDRQLITSSGDTFCGACRSPGWETRSASPSLTLPASSSVSSG